MSNAAATKKHKPTIHSTYLHECLESRKLKRIITAVVKRLYPIRHTFDSIAFRGASGALVAPAVAAKLGKHLLLVRKGEGSHSYHQVEGNVATEKYIIIDDIVASGETVEAIVNAIQRRQEAINLLYDQCGTGEPVPNGKPVLVVCYLWYGWDDEWDYTGIGPIRTIGSRPKELYRR